MESLVENVLLETQEERAKRKRERELSDIRFLLKSPEGRRFIWKLFDEAGNTRMSYTGESQGTAFNEGRRSIGLKILNDLLEAKPEAFMQMQQEYQSELKSEESIDKGIKTNSSVFG